MGINKDIGPDDEYYNNDEYNEFEDDHINSGKDYEDMGHGSACIHCIDAKVQGFEKEFPGRSLTSFKYGNGQFGPQHYMKEDDGWNKKHPPKGRDDV